MKIVLRGLPDMGVGANRMDGRHPMQKYRLKKADQDRWRLLLLEAGYGARETPLFPGNVAIHATLVYPDYRYPDSRNALAALKGLEDLLEVQRVVTRAGKRYVRGFAGLVADDKRITDWRVQIQVIPKLAPRTVLEITGAAEE